MESPKCTVAEHTGKCSVQLFFRSEAFLMRRKSQVELKDTFCSNKKGFVASLPGKPSILKAR